MNDIWIYIHVCAVYLMYLQVREQHKRFIKKVKFIFTLSLPVGIDQAFYYKLRVEPVLRDPIKINERTR